MSSELRELLTEVFQFLHRVFTLLTLGRRDEPHECHERHERLEKCNVHALSP